MLRTFERESKTSRVIIFGMGQPLLKVDRLARATRGFLSEVAETLCYEPSEGRLRSGRSRKIKGAVVATSPKDASKASKILSDSKSSKAEKSVAASDLSQTKPTKKK